MKAFSIILSQIFTLSLIMSPLWPGDAKAVDDDKSLLHIPEGHVVSITMKEKYGPLSGCWENQDNVGGNRWVKEDFVVLQNGTKLKAWTTDRPERIYQGEVTGDKFAIHYQVKDADDFRGKDNWYSTKTGQGKPRPSLAMARKILAEVGQYPVLGYRLDIIDQLSLNGQSTRVEYSHDGEEFISARMRTIASKWTRGNVKLRRVALSGTDKRGNNTIGPESELFIGAESERGCDLTRDHLTVQLYPDNAKDEAVEIILVESEVDSNEYFLSDSLMPIPPKNTSPAWATPYTRLTVIQKGSLRGDSLKVERSADSNSVMDVLPKDYQKMQNKLSGTDFIGKQIEKSVKDKKRQEEKAEVFPFGSDPLGPARDFMKRLEQDAKDRKAAKKKAAAAAKAKAGGIPSPLPGPKPKPGPKPGPIPGPGPNKAGSGNQDIMDCAENSPDLKCWTEDQLRAENKRLEILFRRINGGEGVMIYRRQYKMPNGRFAIRLESSEQAEYRPPIVEMIDETRFIRKQPVLDALRQNQVDINALLLNR